MDHDYKYWRDCIDGRHPPFLDDPQAGFYRRKLGKGGGWLPVAIWRQDDGQLVALDGDKLTEAWRVWGWCSSNATTEQAYRDKCAGKPYHDEFHCVSGGTTTDVLDAPPILPRRHRNGDSPP